VWVVNETFNTIYVFSNDGSKLLKTLGEIVTGLAIGVLHELLVQLYSIDVKHFYAPFPRCKVA